MNSVKPVKKTVIPVAWLGARMLSATKAIPSSLASCFLPSAVNSKRSELTLSKCFR